MEVNKIRLKKTKQRKFMMATTSKFLHLQSSFRKTFQLPRSEAVNWYPGHMMQGLYQIQAKMKKVDCIVEIHDARIPFSGRNMHVRDFIKLRPHILLLNKVDLTDFNEDTQKRDRVVTKLQESGVDTVFFSNLKDGQQQRHILKQILPAAEELIKEGSRYHRDGREDLNFLVLGIPNVGKSTFINSLRNHHMKVKGKATPVGAIAGITRSVLTKIKISTKPLVYVLDTPGILPPKIPGLEVGMRLAACACLPDHLVGEDDIADYILFWLNSRGHFSYVDYFQLEEPTDNITELLAKIAIKNKQIMSVKDMATNQLVYRPNMTVAAQKLFMAFREGKLGKFVLDDDY